MLRQLAFAITAVEQLVGPEPLIADF